MQAGHDLFGVGRESIDVTFGGVTIVTAVVATLLGGWALDRVGSSIKNAMLLNGTCSNCIDCLPLVINVHEDNSVHGIQYAWG